mgnify:CR=1 FL=1
MARLDDYCPQWQEGIHTYDYSEGKCRQVRDAEISMNLGWANPVTGSALIMEVGEMPFVPIPWYAVGCAWRTSSEFLGYFEAAKQHRLVMKKCTACGLIRYPPGAGCPWCQVPGVELAGMVSGKGTIYSYEIIVHSIQPGFRDIAPLSGRDRRTGRAAWCPHVSGRSYALIANLVDDQFNPEAEANVAIGKRVQVVFHDIAEDFTLPQFKLSNEPPQGPVWQFPS